MLEKSREAQRQNYKALSNFKRSPLNAKDAFGVVKHIDDEGVVIHFDINGDLQEHIYEVNDLPKGIIEGSTIYARFETYISPCLFMAPDEPIKKSKRKYHKGPLEAGRHK